MQNPPITVICGLIRNAQNQYFIARRGPHKDHAGSWEFPGGKLEPGESPEHCLQRELMEELGMEVTVKHKAAENHHDFGEFSIRLIAYHCEFRSASYVLSDHDAYRWLPANQLLDYPLSPSDIGFAELLMKGN